MHLVRRMLQSYIKWCSLCRWFSAARFGAARQPCFGLTPGVSSRRVSLPTVLGTVGGLRTAMRHGTVLPYQAAIVCMLTAVRAIRMIFDVTLGGESGGAYTLI